MNKTKQGKVEEKRPEDQKVEEEKKLDQIFLALGDSTRRKILLLIAEKSRSVTEIAAQFDVSLNAISKHLKVLERAGFLIRTKQGRIFNCRMNPEPLASVSETVSFYSKFWDTQLDQLESYLQKTLDQQP